MLASAVTIINYIQLYQKSSVFHFLTDNYL